MNTPLLGVPVRDLVETATRAPSVHNTQPWFWCRDGERVSLFADESQLLEAADPEGRDLVISCGAALHHLRVAAAASGWNAHVKRMPNPYNDRQLANVSFTTHQPTSEDRTKLEALVDRRTDRRRPTAWPVPRWRLDALMASGPPSGATVIAVVSYRARTALRQLLAAAQEVQRRDQRYVDETIRWTGRQDDAGIPATSLLRRTSHPMPSRFPSGTLSDHEQAGEPAEPALLVICTSSDDTASRLRAGEALGSLLVHGTAQGLAMVPLSQAVEVDRTRRLLQDELLDDVACPQIVVQVGWPPSGAAPVPATPRRPVDEVLGEVASLPQRMGPYVP